MSRISVGASAILAGVSPSHEAEKEEAEEEVRGRSHGRPYGRFLGFIFLRISRVNLR